jgi:hypothetical protein
MVFLVKDLFAWLTKLASDCKNVITSLEEGTMGVYTHSEKLGMHVVCWANWMLNVYLENKYGDATLIQWTKMAFLAKDLFARLTKLASACKNVITSLKERTMEVYTHVAQKSLASKGEFDALSFGHEVEDRTKKLIT